MTTTPDLPDVYSAREIARAAGVRPRDVQDLVASGLIQPVGKRFFTEADAIFAVCRTLYLHARSSEAIPLVHGLLDHCERVGDRAQTRRAASVCGLLAAETADLVRSIEYHVQSLRIAAGDEDRLEMARAWNNIGHAITISGRWELSSRCFRRAMTLLEPMVQTCPTRFPAHG